MSHYLILKTEYVTDTVLELRRSDEAYAIESILDSTKRVYSEVSYSAELKGFEGVVDVKILINRSETEVFRTQNSIFFMEHNGRIFKEILGFAKFTLILELEDGSKEFWYTDYITIMVRETGLNQVVNDMLMHIFHHQGNLLLRDASVAGAVSMDSSWEKKDLMSLLVMMENIANTYENYYSFFKINSSYQLQQENTIDRVEKLQHVSAQTLQFIVSHPEYLVESTAGIRVGNQFYQPQKTLMPQNVYTYDIPENRVVVSFLQYMTRESELLLNRIRGLYQDHMLPEQMEDGYIVSSYLIYVTAYRELEEIRTRVQKIREKFESLFMRYQNCLHVQLVDASQMPPSSHIFHSILQYNHIYGCIRQWHDHNGYELTRERLMMSFFDSSSIFEFYVLTKLVEYFTESGYEILEAKRIDYQMESHNQFSSRACNNYFAFEKEDRKVTLYYEPVIRSRDTRELNGLGLYRNNTHSLTAEFDSSGYGEYYTPDYVLKIEEAGQVRYLIGDAKFCNKDQVIQRHMHTLSYKYLFSMSTVDPAEQILGLCIFYGKAFPGSRPESFYDRQLQRTMPVAEMVPLNEGIPLDLRWITQEESNLP